MIILGEIFALTAVALLLVFFVLAVCGVLIFSVLAVWAHQALRRILSLWNSLTKPKGG